MTTEVQERSLMVTTEELAGMLNLAVSTIYQLARQDRLPFKAHYFGRAVRYRRQDVENYVNGLGK
jgi:excisionase family DNA binding protein